MIARRLARFATGAALALWMVAIAPLAHAVSPDEVLPDAGMEARARALSRELRCMVCQNQSIDDSDAPLARDLRLLVRDRLKSGDSDAAVLDFIVARYGDFVLLRPRVKPETLVLWGTPALLLLIGGIALLRARGRRAAAPAPLTADEERRLHALLDTLPPDAQPPAAAGKITKD